MIRRKRRKKLRAAKSSPMQLSRARTRRFPSRLPSKEVEQLAKQEVRNRDKQKIIQMRKGKL